MASTTLSDSFILTRRVAYACCSANFFLEAVQARQVGDEDCYQDKRRLGRLMKYAYDVMCATPTSTEDDTIKCVTHEEACEVAQKADPLCVECGCASETTASGGVPVDCTIEATSVTAFLDTSEIGPPPPGSPVAGDIYVIATDGFVPTAAIQAEWDGASYINIVSPVPAGTIYYDGVTYMVVPPDMTGYIAGGIYPLFPTITVTFTGILGAYSVVSDHPAVALTQGRTVGVQASQDGGATWTTVLTVAEDQIAYTFNFSTLPSIISPTDFRIHYYTADCDYGYRDASFNNTPPFNYVWLATSSEPNYNIYRGSLQGPVPFTVVDNTAPNPGSSAVTMIRRDRSAQGSGNLVYVGRSPVAGEICIRSSSDEGATWSEPGGNWKTSPYTGATEIGQTVHWATRSPFVCIVAGNDKSLHMSQDSGATFDYLPQVDGLEAGVEQIKGAAAWTAGEYIVWTRRSIWKTIDGGTTYTKVINIMTDMPGSEVLYLQIASDVVIAFFDTGYRRSTDKGATWGPLDTSLILADIGQGISDCYPRQDSSGGGQRIMTYLGYSDDYGLTWNAPPSPTPTITWPVGLTHDMWLFGSFSDQRIWVISTNTITALYPTQPNGATGADSEWGIDAKIFP